MNTNSFRSLSQHVISAMSSIKQKKLSDSDKAALLRGFLINLCYNIYPDIEKL